MYATEEGVLNCQWNAANAAFAAEVARAEPAVLFRPRLFLDGNKWCALYGEDLMDGCGGFGDTPEQAMADFNKNWREQKAPRRAA